jgi:hypothetical protein
MIVNYDRKTFTVQAIEGWPMLKHEQVQKSFIDCFFLSIGTQTRNKLERLSLEKHFPTSLTFH